MVFRSIVSPRGASGAIREGASVSGNGEAHVALSPTSVELADQGVRVEWQDGHRSVYPHRFLRLRCPCAHCVDEWTRAARLDPETVPNDVRAVDYIEVGNYALDFLWSDTHHTGIYTYEMLRSLCTCIQCAAQRE